MGIVHTAADCRKSFSTACYSLVRVACAICAVAGAPASADDELKFSDLIGWWSAEPTYSGETSRVLLHFLEEEGKQSVRLSLLAIGGYDVPIGTVSVSGDTLEMEPYPFSLTYDVAQDRLTGYLPEGAVPVYRIPAEFRRIAPFPKPEPPSWDYPRPKVAWSMQLSGPVWAGLERDAETKLLFVGTDRGILHALDGKGTERWTFDAGKAIKARPTVIADALYVTSDAGYLHKLNKRSGNEQWRAKIDLGSPERIPPNQPNTRWDRYASSVVADRSRLYVASRDKHLYALDIGSGAERWRVAAKDMMTATPALYRDLVLFASYDGTVQAVTAKNGKARWRYDAKLAVPGDLAVDGDRVVLGSRSYDLIALDASSGRELWKHYYWFSWIESPPMIRDGIVYTGSSDATGIYAVDLEDGSQRWKTPVPGWAWARTAIDDRTLLVATVGQGPHPGVRQGSLVALDRDSGRIRWIYLEPPSQETVDNRQEWGFAASPLLAEGVAYAVDLDGTVYAIEAEADSG